MNVARLFLLLSQASGAPADPGGSFASLFLWLLILMAALAALGLAVYIARKRFNNEDDEPDLAGGLSIDLLRRMKDQGELTAAEYEAARAVLLRQYERQKFTRRPGKPPSRRVPY
jgi:hypothetical protein